MKFSLNWISDFIETKAFFDKPEKLGTALTLSGLEVDSFEDQRELFKNIFITEIQSSEQHPQADRLSLCKVFDGLKNYTVVCGAKNYKVGDKVILALPGAVLAGGLKIKKSRIRGIESEGMLLSRSELAFPDEEDGIWVLPEKALLGQSFSDRMALKDVIFEITIPPNRSDCLSHRGLAREIACLFSLSFSVPKFSLIEDKSLSVKKRIPVQVKAPLACPRYSGRLIKGVAVGESSDRLKQKLKSLGLKPINNVVDVANFVLWDQGQPLHTFDFNTIQSLTVDWSKKDEKFLALDECERVLTGEEIVIRDKDKILALAGIIGGINSGIKKETKDVFIESAFFAPAPIRKTARRYALETDSSYRFSRGIDPLAVREALDWACFLIQKEAGGELSKDFYDIQHEMAPLAEIEISLEDVEDRLGQAMPLSQFQNDLKRLACQIQKDSSTQSGQKLQKEIKSGSANLPTAKTRFKVLAPSYRRDLKIKEDLIEELARLQGYHKIIESMPPPIPTFMPEAPYRNHQKLRNFLIGKGCLEAINYSFCDPLYYKEFLKDSSVLEDIMGLTDFKKTELRRSFFSINNPLSQQLSLMKPLLVPDLFKNVVNNFRHNNKQGRIFELSPVFYQEGKSYRQQLHLGLALWGDPVDIWSQKKANNLYQLKSLLDLIFEAFQIKVIYQPLKKNIPFLHPQQSVSLIFKNQPSGFLFSLHPLLRKKYKIPVDVALAEIFCETFLFQNKKASRFKPFSDLPSVERDLSFVVPPSLPAEDLRKGIKKSLKALPVEVQLFDIYEQKKERSLSFRVRLEPQGQSWTEEKIQTLLEKAIQQVKAEFSISLKQKN